MTVESSAFSSGSDFDIFNDTFMVRLEEQFITAERRIGRDSLLRGRGY